MSDHRLFVSYDRTALVRIWTDGTITVSTRETPDHIWSAPVEVLEERSTERAA
jgi:hypothetical protein